MTKEERLQAKAAARVELAKIIRSKVPMTTTRVSGGGDYCVFQVKAGQQNITEMVSQACGFRLDAKRGGLGIGGSIDPRQEIQSRMLEVIGEQDR